MISFKQFVTEQFSHTFTNLEYSKAQNAFYRDSNSLKLYRGMELGDEKVLKLPHPTKRPAKNSDPATVLMFNSMINAALGISDVRGSSIFCNGLKKVAKSYGDVHKVYPIGDYKFIWSPKIMDSYLYESRIWDKIENEFRLLSKINILNDLEPFFREMLKAQIKYDTWVSSTSRDKFIREIAEKFIYQGYWANVKTFYKSEEEFLDLFPNMLKEALAKAGRELYQDTDMKKAIESGCEVLIYKSDGYFAVKVE